MKITNNSNKRIVLLNGTVIAPKKTVYIQKVDGDTKAQINKLKKLGQITAF